jgi:hypothetical protein
VQAVWHGAACVVQGIERSKERGKVMVPKRVTHLEYFKGADYLKTNREVFSQNCRSIREVIDLLDEKTGIKFSHETAGEMVKEFKIELKKPSKKVLVVNGKQQRSIVVLCESLIGLMERLGEKVPDELSGLLKHMKGGGYHPKIVDPVPVSRVVDPKTMTVVNGKGEK